DFPPTCGIMGFTSSAPNRAGEGVDAAKSGRSSAVVVNPPLIFDLPVSPLRFEYLSTPAVAALFLILSLPIIKLGRRTLLWQGERRGWTSIGVRLAAIWVVVMILAGARWEQRSKDLDVVVLRDISNS